MKQNYRRADIPTKLTIVPGSCSLLTFAEIPRHWAGNFSILSRPLLSFLVLYFLLFLFFSCPLLSSLPFSFLLFLLLNAHLLSFRLLSSLSCSALLLSPPLFIPLYRYTQILMIPSFFYFACYSMMHRAWHKVYSKTYSINWSKQWHKAPA